MADTLSTMTVDVRPGEHLLLDGERIAIELVDKSGKLARLRVTAPRSVKIEKRSEDESTAMRGTMTT